KKNTTNFVIASILTLAIVCGALVSCKDERSQGGYTNSDGDSDSLTEIITGADAATIPNGKSMEDITNNMITTWIVKTKDFSNAELPELEGAVKLTSSELLSLIREGKVEKNAVYELTDKTGLVFDRDDDYKSYDCGNITVYGAVGDDAGVIHIDGSRKLTLSNLTVAGFGGKAAVLIGDNTLALTLNSVNVIGHTACGIYAQGKEISISGAVIKPYESGAIDCAIISAGDGLVNITNCSINDVSIGVADRSEKGTLIENNEFINCGIGVSLETAGGVCWYNNFNESDVAIKAVFEKAEISAGESDGYNLIAAMNVIKGSKTSVLFENVSNGVILLNNSDNITAKGCVNVYVAENVISGTLELSDNSYIIANGNCAEKIVSKGNSNTNGGTITDLDERLECGANEALLPHTNSEQFVGMPRNIFVKCVGSSELHTTEYILDRAGKGDVVIIPPGVYVNSGTVLENVTDKKIYAYGVLFESATGKETAIKFEKCENVTVKGLFIGSAVLPHIQGTIVETNEGSFGFMPDPGYKESMDGGFAVSTSGEAFKPGESCPYGHLYPTSRSYDRNTGIQTVGGINYTYTPKPEIGDRVSFRTMGAYGGVSLNGCSNMTLEDFTIYCAEGFALHDSNSIVAPTLIRYRVGGGPAPVLDEKKFSEEDELVTKDQYGRLRGPEPINSTVDATHSTNAREGIKLISSLLEHMNDDGGNIHGYFGSTIYYDPATKTLTYSYGRSGAAREYPTLPIKGDELLLYGRSGERYSKVTCTSDGVIVGANVKVTISEDVELGSDTLVQNLDGCGKNFLWDNVMVRDAGSNGLRIQGATGTVKNCSFINLALGGLNMVPMQYNNHECGFSANLVIEDNLFDSLGSISSYMPIWSENGMLTAISFAPRHEITIADIAPNQQYTYHDNISITGNVFRNMKHKCTVSLFGVSNLVLADNTFLPGYKSTDADDTDTPVWIIMGENITVSGNTFPTGTGDGYMVESQYVTGLTCDNIKQ
ncbi:MAG: hypothetical protein ACI4Q6_07100, partial [Huintestinicola sp.]